MTEVVFVKLGGSLITDKTRRETARPAVLTRLAKEIAEAKARRPDLRLLIGHGSGSFGHFAGREYGTRQGVIAGQEDRSWYGFAVTGDAAARLNRLVVEALLAARLPAVSFPPSATAMCQAGELQTLGWRPIAIALRQGLLPVVFGDVAWDQSQGCTIVSTEQIFAFLAERLRPARILLLGAVDGVFTADPKYEPAAQRLPIIHASKLRPDGINLRGSHGVDVTGGMANKVEEMARLVLSRPQLTVHIFSGEQPGALSRALLEPTAELGTRIIF